MDGAELKGMKIITREMKWQINKRGTEKNVWNAMEKPKKHVHGTPRYSGFTVQRYKTANPTIRGQIHMTHVQPANNKNARTFFKANRGTYVLNSRRHDTPHRNKKKIECAYYTICVDSLPEMYQIAQRKINPPNHRKWFIFMSNWKIKQETGITCFTDGFFWLEKSALAEYLDFTERVESGFIRERIK